MLNTYVVYVENKPGVLTRVASLFRRRAFNIDSLTVGRTEKPEVSRMTITVEADRDQARRIEANLYKLVNVLLVENITNQPSIVRDLAMIKVAATHEARSHVLELASVFRARVVDVAPESLTIEITGAEDKIDGLLEVLRPIWRSRDGPYGNCCHAAWENLQFGSGSEQRRSGYCRGGRFAIGLMIGKDPLLAQTAHRFVLVLCRSRQISNLV